jgi:glycosyltransferase involved in cell wall biosynthesis
VRLQLEKVCREIFVVIPAYNEGPVIGETVDELLPYGYTLVVVDDGSTVPARTFLGERPVRCVLHSTNLGQGAALQTGMQYALQHGAKVVVHFDADGQHSPALIRSLVEPILAGECDIVLGSRFINADDRRKVPTGKRILLRAGIFVSWLFSGLWLTDTHNGFRALSREAVQRIRLSENGYAHATEILDLIRKSGLPYKEIPATIRYTEHSVAKGQSMLNSVNILWDLLVAKLLK